MIERLTDKHLRSCAERGHQTERSLAIELLAQRAENKRLQELLEDLVKLTDWTISPEFRARIDAALVDAPK